MGGRGSGGHNRKSGALKQLTGNPGKRPLKNNPSSKPITESKPLSCPRWIEGEARREWRRICKLMPFRETDRTSLEGYCTEYAKFRQAQEYLIKNGYTQIARHGFSPCPEVKIAHDALAQMKAFAVELGITPKSRLDKTPGKSNKPKDGIDRYLNTRSFN